MSCIKAISNGIAISCKPLAGGVNDRLILVNYDDVDGFAYESNTPDSAGDEKYIDAITRTATTKGYLFEGQNNSIVVRKIAERGTFRVAYRTEIDFIAFDESGIVEKTLEDLNKSKVIAFYESNQEFHAIGLIGGMIVQTNNGDTSDADTAGGHRITLLANKEGEYGKRLGVWTGTSPNQVLDYSATKALFDGLLVAAS